LITIIPVNELLISAPITTPDLPRPTEKHGNKQNPNNGEQDTKNELQQELFMYRYGLMQ